MKKKKIVLTGVAIMALIGVVLGATYAYFVAQTGAGQSANVNVQAGTTDSLRFEVTNNLNIYASLENFAEGKDNLQRSTDLKAILKPNNNTNEARYNYYVYLDISKNELEYTTEDEKPELLLKVTKPDGIELTTIEGLEYKSVVNNKNEEVSGFDITTKKGLITVANGYEIYANGSEVTQNWNVEIILVNLGSDQNKNTNKRFDAEAKIQQEKEKTYFLKNGPSDYDFIYGPSDYPWKNPNISKVVFENKIQKYDTETVYDMSRNQDGSILGYEVKNLDDEYYTLYINSGGIMFAPSQNNYWFIFASLNTIEGLNNFDTSNVTNMSQMFMDASRLTTLDLTSFDTSNVTNMSQMFDMNSYYISIKSQLNEIKGLINFDTSKVSDMSQMFSYCNSLTLLDLSSFDTSQVGNMSGMFQGCSSLTSLDISNMTFDKVTWYRGMFSEVPNNIHIKVKDEAAREFIQARLDEAKITEGVIEVVNK